MSLFRFPRVWWVKEREPQFSRRAAAFVPTVDMMSAERIHELEQEVVRLTEQVKREAFDNERSIAFRDETIREQDEEIKRLKMWLGDFPGLMRDIKRLAEDAKRIADRGTEPLVGPRYLPDVPGEPVQA